eukprot:m.464967 g.464967  ORF g.464967 m.464967 type:complete len:71 (+) comp252574_c0_seq1:105-317(+)
MQSEGVRRPTSGLATTGQQLRLRSNEREKESDHFVSSECEWYFKGHPLFISTGQPTNPVTVHMARSSHSL